MAANVRVSVFTPASVAKFTSGAHIRGAFTPRAVAAMPAAVRLKPEFFAPDSTINMGALAQAICVKPGEIAKFFQLSPDRADIKTVSFTSSGLRHGDQNRSEVLRTAERGRNLGEDFTGRMLLGRIGVPEDVLEPFNIASVLKGDMGSFHGDFSLSVKDVSSYDAWALLAAAYVGHLSYQDPSEAGTALGSIAASMKENSDVCRMPEDFLPRVSQLLYPEDKKSAANAFVAALQRTKPGDESAQMHAVVNTNDSELINPASRNWDHWKVVTGSQPDKNITAAISFASILEGDLRISNIISNACNAADKNMPPARHYFIDSVASIVSGLKIGLPKKIDLLIKIAAQASKDETLPEYYRANMIAEELVRELLIR